MRYFAIYNPDGSIERVYFGLLESLDIENYIESGEPINPEYQYVDVNDLVIKNKENFNFNYDNLGEINTPIYFYNLPENTKIHWPDGSTSIESGDVSFEVNATGEYWFMFYNPQKITQRVIINVA